MTEARFDGSHNIKDGRSAAKRWSGAATSDPELRYRHSVHQLKTRRYQFGEESRKLESIMVPIWIGVLSTTLLFSALALKLTFDF